MVAEWELPWLELESTDAEKQHAHELLLAHLGSNTMQDVSSNKTNLPYIEGFKLPTITDGEDELAFRKDSKDW